MPLKHFAEKRRMTPASREKHTHLVGLRNKLPVPSFDKLLRIVDTAIDELVDAKAGGKIGLVYTKTGFLLGHQASAPHKDIEYVWNKVSTTLINKPPGLVWTPLEERHVMKTIGALVMWRMSVRDEDWLCNFKEVDRIDIVTGDEIKIAEYWINTKST